MTIEGPELAILRAIPGEQLGAAVDGAEVSPEKMQRRNFLRAVAASAAALASGEAVGVLSFPG